MRLNQSKILVTGGTGFLGFHLVSELSKYTSNIICTKSTVHDLRKSDTIDSVLGVNRDVDLIVHLAASVGGIGANQDHPGTFFYDNMMMGLNILEGARKWQIPKVIIAGTICSYPKYTDIPFKEDNLWNGYPEETNAPYGIAKKSILVMTQAYRKEFGCNFVTLLPVNLYGPHDNFDQQTSHVIPALIRKIHKAQIDKQDHIVIWGDGTPTREFLYVEDAARAFCLAAEKYDSPDPINIGSGMEISILELTKLIAELMEFEGDIVCDTSKPNGQPRRLLDVTKAKNLLGFEAQVQLKDGLLKTIQYYRDVY